MKLLFRLSQASMWMDDDIWHRHANPWSVYSRISVLPALSLAVWSRVWLGWWSLIPLMLVAAWIWVNPRYFRRLQKQAAGRLKAHSVKGCFLTSADLSQPATRVLLLF